MLTQPTLFPPKLKPVSARVFSNRAKIVKVEHAIDNLNSRLREIYFEIKDINQHLAFLSNEIKGNN